MLSSVWESFVAWVNSAGYPGMGAAMVLEGLGVPFPGDAVMAFYGFMGSFGHFSYPQSVAWCSAGCWAGSLVSFAVGRRFGLPFLHRFGRLLFLQPKHIRFTERLSARYGIWVLVIGRFLPGVRTLSSYFAGIGGMPWRTFIVMSFAGFCLWCAAWLGLGWWLGQNAMLLISKINQILLTCTVLACAGGLLYMATRNKIT